MNSSKVLPVLIASTCVALVTASPAFASCTPPPADFAPAIPDGAAASPVQLAIAAEQVEGFVHILTAFIDCTDEDINRILDDPPPDVDRDEVVAMVEQRGDAVSRRNAVLREFESQLHLFEARVEQADEYAAGADTARMVAEEIAEVVEALRAREQPLGDDAPALLWPESGNPPDDNDSDD